MTRQDKFIFDGLINNHDRCMSDYQTMCYNRHQSTQDQRNAKIEQAAQALKLAGNLITSEMQRIMR